MIGFLLDTSALWHLFRTPGALTPWTAHIATGSFRACEPTRAELLYSATGPEHRDDLASDLDAMCRPVSVPKNAWRWVDTAQYKLTQRGQHRAAGPTDLLICATAVHHDLIVLHVDNDFRAVANVLKDVRERDIRDTAEPPEEP
ncbi:putative nucleic acid-binding protein [Lipingzhangella halophila]|uniref:Ribonuclease VapC n=1 Tax=Lipingzhangella halophila TaxID=1783352 RepID=A0A7W7W361_9ACTN|nr:PIN domain-containing protein [Lipingzhangella halophila]MBB4932712.1 putative nucleic acid-binding protein [Lipingzhangella halophila]